MPWIKVIPENEATGELKEVYEKIAAQRGKSGDDQFED